MSLDAVRLLDTLSPPVGWSEPTDLETDARATRILERVLADTGTVIWLDAARRRRAIAGAVVVGALVAGGAVAAVWNRSPEQAERIVCYSDAAVEPDIQVPIVWDGESDPAQLCATAWSDGAFDTATPDAELQVCVTPEGVTAVIPGDSGVCSRLGLAEFAPLSRDDLALAVAEAGKELNEIFILSNNCATPSEATDLTKRVLAKYGLTGWTITVDGTFSAAEPCASVALEPENTTAYIRPARRG